MIGEAVKPKCPSPIGWLGGKTKLRPTILACFPPHKCFVEVFCGSATVFFGKEPDARIEIINDVHGELVNLMKTISGTHFGKNSEAIRNQFIDFVRAMPASREVYQDWKKWSGEEISKLSEAERAFRFYYCVKKGFSSVPKGGYEASPKSSNRYNMNTDFDKFSARFRASNAQIENLDFRKLIKKYNRKGAKTLFFLDPPYFIANDSNYYDFVFTHQDHEDLKSSCDEVEDHGNQFLITYDDCPEVLHLYKKYYIYRTDPIVYQASDERDERSLIKMELFISNYDIAQTVLDRVKQKKGGDLFATVDKDDSRIDFPDHIGLQRIN